jgi:hypothetical protein
LILDGLGGYLDDAEPEQPVRGNQVGCGVAFLEKDSSEGIKSGRNRKPYQWQTELGSGG